MSRKFEPGNNFARYTIGKRLMTYDHTNAIARFETNQTSPAIELVGADS